MSSIRIRAARQSLGFCGALAGLLVLTLGGATLVPTARAQGAAAGSPEAPDTTTVLEDAPVKPTAPKRYVVRRGDTLWGIANLFLRNPWQWPEIWYVNPQIANPHRIYPGDTVEIALGSDGRTRLQLVRGPASRAASGAGLVATRLEPQLRSSALEAPIDTIPYSLIAAFMSRPAVLTRQQIDAAAYVVALGEDHDIAGTGHEIFVRRLSAQPGERYSVMHIAEPLIDPDSGHRLGYAAIYTGTAQITRAGRISEAVLVSSSRETLQGDVLVPPQQLPVSDFAPHPPARPVAGRIMDVIDNVMLAGQYQVVALNRGSDAGLDRGSVLTVDQEVRHVADPCVVADGVSACAIHHTLALPTDPAGTVLVFRTYPHVSYALVMTDTVPVRLGNHVHSP